MSTSIANPGQTTAVAESYLAIPVATLCASHSLKIDLFLRPAAGGSTALFRDGNYPLTVVDLAELASKGVESLYIRAEQSFAYQEYLRENLDSFLEDSGLGPTERYQCLNESGRELLRQSFSSFQGGNTDRMLEEVKTLGDHMAKLLVNQTIAASDLFRILRHDYHTYTHSFNVSSYCLLLATALKIADENDLKQIAVGGLLHDAGKLRIPLSILTKRGRLTEAERAVIERHPTLGFEDLASRADLNWGQLMMVYQHHERNDGTGFPVRAIRSEIHDWARLCAVVDVFEAMTSNRPYRKSMPIGEVLEYLDKLAGTTMDKELVRCWKSVMNDKQ